MHDIVRILFFETWWTWARPPSEPYALNDYLCRSFNSIEALAWFQFAILVLRRWMRYRRSLLEVSYAVAFILFGISDVIETWELTSWLLWWKAANLTVLFVIRRSVMHRFYPDARIF